MASAEDRLARETAKLEKEEQAYQEKQARLAEQNSARVSKHLANFADDLKKNVPGVTDD